LLGKPLAQSGKHQKSKLDRYALCINDGMRYRYAFTLIELLVVIAIIAILAAILFPVFSQAKLAAKKTVSLSNMKEVGLASVLYFGDYDDTAPPLFYFDPSNQTNPSTFGLYYWPVLELPYMKNEQVFVDPLDTGDDPAISNDGLGHSRFDPANTYHHLIMGAWPSYGFNYRYMDTFVNSPDPNGFGMPFYYKGNSVTGIANSAGTVLFAEATAKDVTDPQSGHTTTTTVGYAKIDPPSKWLNVPYPDARSQGHLWPRYSKNTLINVGWVDGHVKTTAMAKIKGTGTTPDTLDVAWNGQGN